MHFWRNIQVYLQHLNLAQICQASKLSLEVRAESADVVHCWWLPTLSLAKPNQSDIVHNRFYTSLP